MSVFCNSERGGNKKKKKGANVKIKAAREDMIHDEYDSFL